MPKILECVPNFSEGRDKDKIIKISNSVQLIKSVKVLDLHSDPDHNRSVITFIGDPEAVKQAAFNLTAKALELIDINLHDGVHPYIGAVDVIPLIPIPDSGCPMPDAVRVAQELGKKVATELALPVYFYGEAALIPERKDLPQVRKGGYQTLKKEIDQPPRIPDLGKTELHPTAGAVAIGARNFLIAFNINLNTWDLDIAKTIAKAIRETHGGLPGVRALGLPLKSRGITQVSINITDHQETSLKQVFDQVSVLGEEFGVEVIESELVGLIPEEAAFPQMEEYLRLKEFSQHKILENHL